MDADRVEEERDEALAAKAAGGDRDAFEALMTRHRASVYRLCRSVTGNHDDADDAAQETFVRVHKALGSFDPSRPFGPWVRKIAWNAALTVGRDAKAGVLKVSDEDAPEAVDPAPGPEAAMERWEEGERMAKAVESLPVDLRTVLLLRALDGLSYAEIAETAGIPAGTVMSRLSRARERLMAAMGAGKGGST